MTRRKRPRPNKRVKLRGWVIAGAYVVASVTFGLTLPRLESAYFPGLAHGTAVPQQDVDLNPSLYGYIRASRIANYLLLTSG